MHALLPGCFWYLYEESLMNPKIRSSMRSTPLCEWGFCGDKGHAAIKIKEH